MEVGLVEKKVNALGLDVELSDLIKRAHRSLVVVRNGHFGAGSGVIIRQDGFILTNNHVVGKKPPRVIMEDNQEIQAEIVAREAEIDLALLKVPTDKLVPAEFAQQGVRVGEIALAIGHPWGQRGCVTAGVVSSLTMAHTHGKRRQVPVIRTDAALAPGNSGGPLINAAGEILGINTLIVGGDQGVAISEQVARAFVAEALLKSSQPSASNNGKPGSSPREILI